MLSTDLPLPQNLKLIITEVVKANLSFDSDELSSPIVKLVADMHTKDENAFKRGKISIWAAALIYVVAKENNMHYSDTENPITLDRVAEYFGDKKRTIGNKASKIYNEMGMSQFAPKYSIWVDNDTYLDEEEDFITLVASIELSWPKEKISELWEKFTDEFNIDELGYFEILEDEVDGNKMTLTFEVADFFADEFINRLSFIGEVIEVNEDTSNINDFLPMEHYETFMRYHTSMNLNDMSFDSIDDANIYLQQFQNIPIDELANNIPQNPVDQAEIQALDAYKLPKEESLASIENILKNYPHTVEAYICKAGWEPDPENQLDILYEALEAGDKKLDIKEINREKMWWKYHLTRPYMRALNILALQLFRLEYIKESIEVIEDLLNKNPDDNLGMRYFAIQVYVENGKWVKLKDLFQLFPEEDSIEFDLARMAYFYYKGKTKSQAKRYLEKILLQSPSLQSLCNHESVPDSQEDRFIMAVLDNIISKDKKLAKWFSITLYDIYEKNFGNDSDQEAKVIPFDFGNPN